MSTLVARAATLALLLTATGCASVTALEPPQVEVTSVSFLEPMPGSLEQRFAVGLRLLNPNNRALAIDGLDFDLDLNDRRLASGVTNQPFELPRLGQAETSVIVTTSVREVLRQALDLGTRLDAPMDYRVRGRVHLGTGFIRSVPFDYRGRLAR
jgi:LEA14-like dessication related protein